MGSRTTDFGCGRKGATWTCASHGAQTCFTPDSYPVVDFLRGNAEKELAAGFEYASDFVEEPVWVGEVLEDFVAVDGVEEIVLEWEWFFADVEVEDVGKPELFGVVDEVAAAVDAIDVVGACGECLHEVAGAEPDFENPAAGDEWEYAFSFAGGAVVFVDFFA